MPKMKSHSGLKKRVKRTGTGKLKRGRSYTSHLANSKNQNQKRRLRKAGLVSSSDMKRIKTMLYKK